jgi:hypothetical protein
MRKDPPSERVEPFARLRIPIATPDDARRVIGELANKEVDFLKIRTVQDEATYLALNEAAHAHKLRLTGHVGNLNPGTVLKAGQDDIEHGFYPPITSGTREQRIAMWRGFAERGVIVAPTMVVAKDSVLAPIDHLSAMMDDVGWKIEPRRPYVSLFCLKDWREQLSETTPERQKAYQEIAADMLSNLRRPRCGECCGCPAADSPFLRGAFYDRAGIDGLLEKVKAAEDITADDWGRK